MQTRRVPCESISSDPTSGRVASPRCASSRVGRSTTKRCRRPRVREIGMRAWTIRDSMELYQVPQWGRGFFGIDELGNVLVQPRGPEGPSIALPTLVEDLRQRGLRTPLLLRFSDILA